MNVGERIKKRRKKLKISVDKLAEMIGKNRATVYRYENNEIENMPYDVITPLAEALKVSPSYLMGWDNIDNTNEPSELYHIKEVVELPIVGTVACGNGVLAYQDIEGYEKIPRDWVKGAEHFLLKAKGDSMINARINDGDLLLIRQQEAFEVGEIMAVIIDDEAVLKRIYKTDSGLMLQSENTKYPPMFINDQNDVRIVGKLKMNLISY